MQLFSADPTMFFCTQKVEKTTLKSCSEFSNPLFFSYCPDCPNGPDLHFCFIKKTQSKRLSIGLGHPYGLKMVFPLLIILLGSIVEKLGHSLSLLAPLARPLKVIILKRVLHSRGLPI